MKRKNDMISLIDQFEEWIQKARKMKELKKGITK